MRLIVLLAAAALAPAADMTCRRAGTPVDLRAEGLTEMIADAVLTCTGGTPVKPGAGWPPYEVVVSANVPLSGRTVAPQPGQTWALSDALLMVDEPGGAAQILCTPPDGAETCAPGANVFRARVLQDNAVVFHAVPLNPPGKDGTRTIRITNLRVDASVLAAVGSAQQVRLAVQIFSPAGDSLPIENFEDFAGGVAPGLAFSVRTADDLPVAAGDPALTVTPAMVPMLKPDPSISFNVKFSERFASAFKRRNVATSSGDARLVVTQAEPGTQYYTETGVFNSGFAFPLNTSPPGLADSGTRLKAVFHDIPNHAHIWVSARDVPNGTTNYSGTAPKAVLIYADNNGGGAFSPVYPPDGLFAELFPSDGTVTAVWEVVGPDPLVIEDISFAVTLSGYNAQPSFGVATVSGGFAPVNAGDSAAVPRFVADTSKPVPAFAVGASTAAGRLISVNAASDTGSVAPGCIVSAYGSNLARTTQAALGVLPLSIAGVSVEVIDGVGVRHQAPLLVVSPTQINFVLDDNIRLGPAIVNVTSDGKLAASGPILIEAVSPALFAANGGGRGVASGELLRLRGAASLHESLCRFDDAAKIWVAAPIALGPDGDLIFLTLYGTGIRGRSSPAAVKVTVGGLPLATISAGPQGGSPGLDQVIAGPLARELAGRGEVEVAVTVDGKAANRLTIAIQ